MDWKDYWVVCGIVTMFEAVCLHDLITWSKIRLLVAPNLWKLSRAKRFFCSALNCMLLIVHSFCIMHVFGYSFVLWWRAEGTFLTKNRKRGSEVHSITSYSINSFNVVRNDGMCSLYSANKVVWFVTRTFNHWTHEWKRDLCAEIIYVKQRSLSSN